MRIRPKWWAAGGAAVAVIAGAALGGYLWLISDRAVPVDIDEVVEQYRTAVTTRPSSTTVATTVVEATAPPVVSTVVEEAPAVGVYVYDTVGSEGVDALGGSAHDYPAATTVTVTDVGGGCVRTRWDALEQRWDDARICAGSNGWNLAAKTVFHSFFHQSDERVYTCDDGSIYLPATLTPGVTFSAHCTSAGTGESGASTERIDGRVIGSEVLDVGDQRVETVHVRYEIVIGGRSTGRADVDRWYAVDVPTLLVREVRAGATASETAIGTVHYEERYEMTVRSLEPIA